MKQYRGYVFRLYPNDKQKELMNKQLGTTRFIYNYFLDLKKKEYEEKKKTYSCFDMIKMLPELSNEYQFLKEVDSCILRNSLFNLEDSYKRFYKGEGYPKFKKKGIRDSFKTNNVTSTYKGKIYNSIEIDKEKRILKLPKLGNIKIRGYRNLSKIEGIIKSATVRKSADKYYASILIEEEIEIPNIKYTSIVGIDLGIKDMIVTSNGIKLNNPNKERLDRLNKRLRGLNKKLSRSKIGSKNRYKTMIKIQEVYKKIRNLRKHLINTMALKIVKNNDIIVLEDLDIKNMYQTKRIARKLVNIPLYNLIETIKWKAYLFGKKVIQINRYYPSSQECNVCGRKNEEVKNLNIRKWECEACHNIHDRDLNASINIMFEGLKKYINKEYV